MAADIRSRASWDARYSDGDLTLYGMADEVFAHHTVTAQLSPSASVAAEEAEMRKIEAVGQSRFGTGISYNVIIFPSGRAYQGASWGRRGTHTGGRNSTSRSICFAGNYESNKPTAAQLATAAAIYREGKGKWWKSSAPLRGHRDVKQTACPGKNVYDQLPAIRAGKTPTPQKQQEEPDMNATQAKQLSDIHAALEKLNELYTGVAPRIDATEESGPGAPKVTFRTGMKQTRLAVLGGLDDAVARGVRAAVASLPGVDQDAITKGVVGEVRKTLQSVEDTEYILTPKES